MTATQTVSRILLITGVPGIGKTTVVRKVAHALGNTRICGFYTKELRELGVRRGFHLVGFDGTEGLIAHVDMPHRWRVGKYGVDVGALNRLAAATLALREDCAVYLVDEIGKMECLAPGFEGAMRTLLASGKPLVATISKRGGGFIEEVKARHDIEPLEVTRANRDTLPQIALDWLSRHGVNAR